MAAFNAFNQEKDASPEEKESTPAVSTAYSWPKQGTAALLGTEQDRLDGMPKEPTISVADSPAEPPDHSSSPLTERLAAALAPLGDDLAARVRQRMENSPRLHALGHPTRYNNVSITDVFLESWRNPAPSPHSLYPGFLAVRSGHAEGVRVDGRSAPGNLVALIGQRADDRVPARERIGAAAVGTKCPD